MEREKEKESMTDRQSESERESMTDRQSESESMAHRVRVRVRV